MCCSDGFNGKLFQTEKFMAGQPTLPLVFKHEKFREKAPHGVRE